MTTKAIAKITANICFAIGRTSRQVAGIAVTKAHGDRPYDLSSTLQGSKMAHRRGTFRTRLASVA